MEFVGFIFDNWYWFLAAYAFAVAVCIAVFVVNELGSHGYRFSIRHGFRFIHADVYAAAYGHSDPDCRSNLGRAVNRKPGRRSIQRPAGVVRSGHHAAGGNGVQSVPETLAS